MRRLFVLGALLTSALLWLAVAHVAVDGSQSEAGADQFCVLPEYVGLGQQSSDFGQYRLAIDQPASLRDFCVGQDLWVYSEQELANIDGVLFDDCVIAWTSGGRSLAHEVNVPCVPSTG